MRTVLRSMAVATLATLIVGVVAPAGATTVGGDVRISRIKDPSFERRPAVAWNQTTREFLVVWEDTRNNPIGAIYGRRVGADGKPIGGEIRISGAKAAVVLGPAIAWNQKTNEYLVVWTDERNAGTSNWDIYGRRVGADGKPVGGDFRISGTRAIEDESQPAVAWNKKANQWLVVWTDERDRVPRGDHIYGRRVGADGKPVGGDFRISGSAATGFEQEPDVAYSESANTWMVVWTDGRDAGPGRGTDIYGRRVGADGKPVGGDSRISGSAATSDEFNPAVAWNQAAKRYLVVWEDERNLGSRGWDIYGQRIGADGNLVGGDFRISGAKALNNEFSAAVAYSQTSNQWLVVWVDRRSELDRGWDIYGRRVRASGKLAGKDFRISGAQALDDESQPAVAWNGTVDEHLVVWQDYRNFGKGMGIDIYARRAAGS